jgi:hypothetical protein
MPSSFSADGTGAAGYAAVADNCQPRVAITILSSPYAKHGTSIDVRLVIFDKGWSGRTQNQIAPDIRAALPLVLALPQRLGPEGTPPPSVPAVRPLPRLRAGGVIAKVPTRKPAAPLRIAASGQEPDLVTYRVREEPLLPASRLESIRRGGSPGSRSRVRGAILTIWSSPGHGLGRAAGTDLPAIVAAAGH